MEARQIAESKQTAARSVQLLTRNDVRANGQRTRTTTIRTSAALPISESTFAADQIRDKTSNKCGVLTAVKGFRVTCTAPELVGQFACTTVRRQRPAVGSSYIAEVLASQSSSLLNLRPRKLNQGLPRNPVLRTCSPDSHPI